MSDKHSYSLDSALQFGWHGMLRYFVALTGIVSAACLLTLLPILFGVYFTFVNDLGQPAILGLLVSITATLLPAMVEIGMINVQLMILQEKPVATSDVFSVEWPQVWSYLGATIIYRIIMCAGYICFIIPGVLWQIKAQFYGYFIIEEKKGAVDSLKASFAITEGNVANLFVFGIIQQFINSIGAMALLVGSFPAWIVNKLATAHIYRQLTTGVIVPPPGASEQQPPAVAEQIPTPASEPRPATASAPPVASGQEPATAPEQQPPAGSGQQQPATASQQRQPAVSEPQPAEAPEQNPSSAIKEPEQVSDSSFSRTD
jgi:hypothetical protein